MATLTKQKSNHLDRKPGRNVKATTTTVAGPYQPTTKEAAVICKMAAGLEVKAPIPRLKISDDGKQISIDHPNELVGLTLFMNATGTKDPEFAKGMICHLAQISLTDGEKNQNKLNFAVSAVAGDQPTDQDETLIGVLKAAAYLCSVKSAVHYQNAQTIMEADIAERGFNKFAKTFALLQDTLMRKRSGNEQKVVVQNNVAVNDNGQAVIGNVNGPQTTTRAKER